MKDYNASQIKIHPSNSKGFWIDGQLRELPEHPSAVEIKSPRDPRAGKKLLLSITNQSFYVVYAVTYATSCSCYGSG